MTAVIISGALVGLIYGLLGTGLVVVYRGSRVINFAYGAAGMVGAFTYAEIRAGTGPRFGSFAGGSGAASDGGLWPALPAGILVAAALGLATELLVVRPLRNAPRLGPTVGTFAVGSLMLVFAVRRWGTDVHSVLPLVGGQGVQVGDLRVSSSQLLVLCVAPLVLTALWAMYRYLAFGMRLRALAQDPYAAALSGIDVNRTSMLTWGLAGGLAGLSAILIAPLVGFNVAFMTTLAVRGLAAALIGGLTNFPLAFVAGVGIGVLESVTAYKLAVPSLIDVIVAAVVIALLLLGKKSSELAT